MIADLPPMQATERHYKRNDDSLSQCRAVQHANGTALVVFLVCKAFDYGVVSVRRTLLCISILRVVTLSAFAERGG